MSQTAGKQRFRFHSFRDCGIKFHHCSINVDKFGDSTGRLAAV